MKFTLLHVFIFLTLWVSMCLAEEHKDQVGGPDQCSGQGHAVYDAPKYDLQYGDVQNCPQIDKKLVLETLPGKGWDNLRNVGMGTVLMLNYSNCRMTSDGKFLIPNNVEIEALKDSNVHLYSSLITHFSNYTSMTSHTINVEAHGVIHGFFISGSYSEQHRRVKMALAGDQGVTSRSELRFRQYEVCSTRSAASSRCRSRGCMIPRSTRACRSMRWLTACRVQCPKRCRWTMNLKRHSTSMART